MLSKRRVCQVSDFFERACNGPFKEAITSEVRLPEVAPKMFDRFIDWLYSGKIQAETPRPPYLVDDEWWTSAGETYKLAAYLQCRTFGNDWLGHIWSLAGSSWERSMLGPPSSTIIHEIYASTTRHCGLQRLTAAAGA